MISLGKNISKPKEEFFFGLADVFPQREHFAVLL
jgi:hypothetical protein